MARNNMKIAFLGALAAFAAVSSAVYAQNLNSQILSSLDRGMWELRAIGSGPSRAAKSRICVGQNTHLVQIQHGDAACSHRVLSEKNNRVTVSYSCRGLGQGTTVIRKETGGLVQINSQGIRGGAPFNFTVEARRIGGC